MTNLDLALSYITKARKRLKILDVLFAEEDTRQFANGAVFVVETALKLFN